MPITVRTYDLKKIAANAHVSGKEEADELEAQCVDCGSWIGQDQDTCVCGSLVCWKGSETYRRAILVADDEMCPAAREFLKLARTTRFRNGREYHRFIQAAMALSKSEVRSVLASVETNLRESKTFSSRAFIKYALNALEQRAGTTTARSSLLEGEDVFRG